MGKVIRLNPLHPKGWTVEEALEHALENVRNGSYPEDKIYIALGGYEDDGISTRHVMAGMDVMEAIGWLYMHMQHISSESD